MARGKTIKKPMNNTNSIYYCTMQFNEKCKSKNGLHEDEKNFYMASNLDFFANGRISICKDCLKEYVYIDGEINLDRFKKILRMIDYPFYNNEFETALTGKNETVGSYFKNIMLNHKGSTWNNGDLDSSVSLINNQLFESSNIEVTPEMVIRWGKLPKEDIEFLETNYYQWVTRHKCETKAEETLYAEITQMQLDIRKTRENGGDVTKKVEALQKLFQSANIRPLDQNAINSSENNMMIGTIISTIEKYEPSEYFDEYKKSQYKDYMGYKKYFTNWVQRPLKNLLSGSKDFNIVSEVDMSDVENFKDGDINGKL